ncbi:excisionase family DNA-binding protein [Rhodococcus pyridinivorans]|uniref:excisionase family DNA-binding protein n=1 Tax=Rhodococcus pyridinivorans TaxID=103816 RepID=UPI001FFF2635|nr:excisionase family DNA-binding protein [Rhodococcus pyridinivorans]UPK64663.1 excisionase family DNA-binding protein [Rhodococcus pyridinivorans]
MRWNVSEYSPRKFETIEQCADRLAVSTRTIRRAIDDGKLTVYGWSRRMPRLDVAEVDEAFTHTA